MLKNIKSTYFIKKLFNYVDEKQKLKIVKCNKDLQNNIDISIINYKYFSERYIIYESNVIGREYNSYSDKLIYEGEYLNGKRNGKGKEYDNYFGTIYEGEYLNGKRNGKGKEYHRTGEIIFEGEYFDNKRWIGTGYVEGKKIYTLSNDTNGKGQEFNDFGTLIFEGEYLEGKRNGKGKEYDYNGKHYYLKVNIKMI